jgi:hypothetical protein
VRARSKTVVVQLRSWLNAKTCACVTDACKVLERCAACAAELHAHSCTQSAAATAMPASRQLLLLPHTHAGTCPTCCNRRPLAAGTLTPLTPTRSGIQPAAAPLLMNDREMIGRKLAHAFPWNATAQVHLAMALRRREAYVSSGAATIKLQCSWQVGLSFRAGRAGRHSFSASRAGTALINAGRSGRRLRHSGCLGRGEGHGMHNGGNSPAALLQGDHLTMIARHQGCTTAATVCKPCLTSMLPGLHEPLTGRPSELTAVWCLPLCAQRCDAAAAALKHVSAVRTQHWFVSCFAAGSLVSGASSTRG